jgi:hypothetical protein
LTANSSRQSPHHGTICRRTSIIRSNAGRARSVNEHPRCATSSRLPDAADRPTLKHGLQRELLDSSKSSSDAVVRLFAAVCVFCAMERS